MNLLFVSKYGCNSTNMWVVVQLFLDALAKHGPASNIVIANFIGSKTGRGP